MATNKFMSALKDGTNYTYTENGAVTHKSTGSNLYDMFALGASMRNRPDNDIILMFKKAYDENPEYALKCLFYLRDIESGAGERRFFRLCMHWLASYDTEAAKRNMKYIPIYARWDDFYCFVDTPLEKDAFEILHKQIMLDLHSKTPSLLAKWLKSQNTSSPDSRTLGELTRKYFHMSAKQYRKTLSKLRKKINVLERLMSANRWDQIEFEHIPSKAGIIYKNAFARHDVERAKRGARTYEDFAKDTATKVNAKTLYPYEVVSKVVNLTSRHGGGWLSQHSYSFNGTDTDRAIINKYWANLKDYFDKATLDALCVVDTSASMTGPTANAPINIAISLGLYCAERNNGPFHNHYISFSSKPQLIETEGVDFVDKVERIYSTNLCENTNIEATFDLILNTAIKNHLSQEALPKNLIVCSDMEFDQARGYYHWSHDSIIPKETLIEGIRRKWNEYGYQFPKLIFWNVDARQNNIPMKDEDGITFVSGASPVVFDMLMSGKSSLDLMYDKLDSKRYAPIH